MKRRGKRQGKGNKEERKVKVKSKGDRRSPEGINLFTRSWQTKASKRVHKDLHVELDSTPCSSPAVFRILFFTGSLK